MRTATEICRLSSDPDGLGHLKFASHLAKVLTANPLLNRLGVILNLIKKAPCLGKTVWGAYPYCLAAGNILPSLRAIGARTISGKCFIKTLTAKYTITFLPKGKSCCMSRRGAGFESPYVGKQRLVNRAAQVCSLAKATCSNKNLI